MTSITNGWDAILALNADQINNVFFQHYLTDGPINPVTPIQLVVPNDPYFYLLDAYLGPPVLSFSSGLGMQTANLSMFFLKGSLIQFDPDQQVVRSVLQVDSSAELTGQVDLARVLGTDNVVGWVTLDFGTGSYAPVIPGVPAGSILATEMGAALQAFFAGNGFTYELTRILSSDVPAPLQPTTFELATQPTSDNTGDGCVLVFIRTTGGGGPIQPLEPYPIPSGQSAVLLVANAVIFNGVLPPALTSAFQNMGTSFTGQLNNDGAWQTVGSGGSIDFGVLPAGGGRGNPPYSSDSNEDPQSVVLPLSGFTVAPTSDGSISAAWTFSWEMGWTYSEGSYDGIQWLSNDSSQVTASYNLSTAGAVDSSDVVTFAGQGTPQFGPADSPPSWLASIFGSYDIPSDMQNSLQSNLAPVFNTFQIPDIDTFALANLLFPGSLKLTSASIPCDLQLTGTVQPRVNVTPAQSTVQAGGSLQLNATLPDGGGTFTWSKLPCGLGTITPSGGLYTAPSSVASPLVVVVSAVDNADTTQTGSALVVVVPSVPAGSLTISPPSIMLTAGWTFTFVLTDANGQHPPVTWTLTPDMGTIKQGWGAGEWIYTAPISVEAACAVSLTATTSDAPVETGSATVNLTPCAALSVCPSQSSLAANGSVTLKASAPGVENYSWMLSPQVGSLVVSNDDSSQATYTAPATIDTDVMGMVVVYSLDNGTTALGVAALMLTEDSGSRTE